MKMPLASIGSSSTAAADKSSNSRRLGSTSGGSNALLRKASRKLDGSSPYQQSIQFSKCVDIKTLPDNYDFDDDMVISTMKSGDMLSAKSYVIFNWCSGDTSSCDEDEKYIVDINTYTKNIASYFANYEGTICQACNKYADFCSSSGNNDDGNYGEYVQILYWFDWTVIPIAACSRSVHSLLILSGNRKLKNFDCDECTTYNCFSQNNNNNNYNEAMNNLIDDISDCLRTGSYASSGEELYVGPMCSANGKGVELALFLDNTCTTYTTQKAFADLQSYYMYSSAKVFNATQDSFQQAFSETVSCESLDIANPYNQADDDGANYDGNGDMNDYCQQLFDEGGALGLSSCSSANDDQNGNYDYGQNDDGSYGDDDFLSWYTYDMTNDNAQDINQVCSAVSQMGGSYSNYYDKDKSGTWNTVVQKSSVYDIFEELGEVNFEEGDVIIGAVLSFFFLGAVVGGAWLYKKQQAKLANDKLEPLNNETFDSVVTEGVMT